MQGEQVTYTSYRHLNGNYQHYLRCGGVPIGQDGYRFMLWLHERGEDYKAAGEPAEGFTEWLKRCTPPVAGAT